ncbi:glycerate kinase family protein [Kutzneria sp. CA-103260]|uniref:glycerate kinase family protein n=1 Tax=Kutzneria sp. CA-103260 TaxID=2802641 RepID=UPI001BA83C43|nr:glycerate kinase [Kutzneria sp. CA-103260]QUQ65408.1 glycerate kinase [Kutzneria sp. CA-103260]
MRVLVAPNAFRGGPGARWVGEALTSGLMRSGVVGSVVTTPLSDGGDGALDVAAELLGGTRVRTMAEDPLGAPVAAEYLLADDGTAFVETAQASGLRLVAARPRQPLVANTRGTGQLIAHAVRRGATRVVVTAGGTASVDVGAGALAAMGVRFHDASGRLLTPAPRDLVHVRRVDTGPALDLLRDVRVEVLSDVSTPLRHNIERFGAQKGITPSDAAVLRRGLDAVLAAFGRAGETLGAKPFFGAGGGLAAGLHAVFDAPVNHGGEYFASLAGLAGQIERADLVLTAEGRFDRGSWEGKIPGLVATMAMARGKRVVIIAGELAVPPGDLPEGVHCVELGLEPPTPANAETAERWHAFERAAQSALDCGVMPHAR